MLTFGVVSFTLARFLDEEITSLVVDGVDTSVMKGAKYGCG